MLLCNESAAPTDESSGRPFPQLADAGQMTLRVRASGCEERVVQIRSAKCTIGSAAGCTLRIRADGVGPLHCWILRGAAGSVIRRLHGPATLNGGQFDDSALRIGDRLRIGSVELEVVEFNRPMPPPAPAFSPRLSAPDATAEVADLKGELATIIEQNLRLEGEARQGFQSSIMAAERADQLRDALAAAHEQLEEACRELALAQETIDRQTGELKSDQSQLQAVRDQLATEAAALEQVRRASEEAANERARLVAEVAEARSAVENDRQRSHEERTQLERRLEQRDAELTAVRSTATAQTSSLTVMIDEMTRSKDSATESISARCAELEAQQAARQSEIESLRRIVGEQTIIEGRFEKLTRDYDLRCIELEEARNQVTAATAVSSRSAEEAEERAEALTRWQEELAGREQRLAEANQQLAAQREATQAESQSFETSRQELAAQRTQIADERSEFERQHEQLAHDRGELESQREQLAAEQAQLADQRTQFEADRQQIGMGQTIAGSVSDREIQLEQQAAEVEQQIAAANARLAELDQIREQLTAEREANHCRALELDQRQNELESRGQELEARASLLESLRSDLNQQAADLALQQQSIEEQRAALESQRAAAARAEVSQTLPAGAIDCGAQPEPARTVAGPACNVTSAWMPPESLLHGDEAAVAEPAAQLPVIEPPAHVDVEVPAASANAAGAGNVDTVLSRLVKAGLWREGEEPPAEQAAHAAGKGRGIPTPPTTSDLPGPALAASEADVEVADGGRDSTGVCGEEESIESYMERLLKRVKGDSTRISSAAPMKFKPVTPSPPAAVPSATALPADQTANDRQVESEEYSPRRTAPELSTNLTAMRDLANSAARSAIDRHVRKHTGKQVAGKLMGAFLTVTASGLLSYWAWKTNSFQAAVGAGIGGAAGAYWTLAAIRRLFGLMRLNKPRPEPKNLVATDTTNSPPG